MAVTLKDLSKVDVAYNPTGGRYIMALDSGTTSVRAVIVDEYDCIVAQASRRIKTFYPRPGWVEQDPMEILASQIAVMMEVQFKSGIHSDRIAAIGITNQRETAVVWDRDSGLPVHNAIVWQCRRTSEITDALIADGMSDIIRDKTGLMPDPYFSGTKIKWILDNVDGARAAADAGELMFGTIDTWLIYNLTGGMVHATDYTNASRTMLFNIHTLEWDDELLELLDVPRSMLPEVKWSSDDYGSVSNEIMTYGPSITGVAGDQQASLFGHCCFRPGCTKNTYGTGCFMLMNTGDTCVKSERGLVSTIGIALDGKISYALEVRFSTPGPPFSGFATSSACFPAPRRRPICARAWKTTAGAISCQLSAAWAPRGGTPTHVASSVGSPARQTVRRLCVLRASPWRIRVSTFCTPCSSMPVFNWRFFRLTEAPRATTSSCSFRPTCCAFPLSRRKTWRPRLSVRPISPGLRSGTGRTSRSSSRTACPADASSPRWPKARWLATSPAGIAPSIARARARVHPQRPSGRPLCVEPALHPCRPDAGPLS